MTLAPDAAAVSPISRLSPCVSPSLCGRMPDAVTPGPGSCLPVSSPCVLSPCVLQSLVRVSRLSPCVSQFLRSEARCCDAGSGVVSPACLPVSPSLYGQMPDALTPSCLPLVSLISLCGRMPDAVTSLCIRCCDSGSGVVSNLSPCFSQSLRCCDAGSGVVTNAFRIQAIVLLEDVRRH